MKSLNIFLTICTLLVLGVSANAQQDPADLGNADSIFIVVSQPDMAGNHSTVQADLYFYNDVQDVASATIGFSWDNPNLVMDSAAMTPLSISSFDFLKQLYYKGKIDSTNSNKLFQFVGSRMFSSLPADAAPQHVASYWFSLANWSVNDSICIDYAPFSAGAIIKYVTTDGAQYPPIYRDNGCQFDPARPQLGLLEVSPTFLEFSAETGGPNPGSLPLSISEADGGTVPFAANTEASWINLSGSSGNTPNDINVSVDISGLLAGIYNDSIEVISDPGQVTNPSTWVPVTLVLAQGNRAPILNAIGDQPGDENEEIIIVITASDPDGDPISFTPSTLPDGAVFVDSGNGVATFTWTPTFEQAGGYPLTVTVSDGSLSDEESITITITNVNRPPVLATIGPQEVVEEALLSFTVSASDPDGNTPTLAAAPLPPGATFSPAGLFEWTPTNVQEGIYDIMFGAYDGEAVDEELVRITVTDGDVITFDIDTLAIEIVLAGPDPDSEQVTISIPDGRVIPILIQEDIPWLRVEPTEGFTPLEINIFIDPTGLDVGLYIDSILVIDNSGPSKDASDPLALLDSAWIQVQFEVLEPAKLLVSNKEELNFVVSIGAVSTPTDNFDVTEIGGSAINCVTSSGAAWLTLAQSSDVTPATVTVGLELAGMDPGDYSDSIMVTSDNAENSPIWVYVNLSLTPCPTLMPASRVYYDTIFAGETAMVSDVISVTSSGPGEIEWETAFGAGSDEFCSFDPMFGTSPTSVALDYSRTFETEGSYADTAFIRTSAASLVTNSCYSEIPVIVNVTVHRPPSADTVIVSTVPSVPGMKVIVPVLFTNSCLLEELSLNLSWGTDEIYLDSVSFEGSAISYIADKQANWNNVANMLSITAADGDQASVPRGSLQLLANLHFALSCEIANGVYPIDLVLTDSSVVFTRNCEGPTEIDIPEFIGGNIVVGDAVDFVCGYVVDPDMNEIPGATVQLWTNYPTDGPHLETSSSGIGSFAFENIEVNPPYDLYAYKEGYYPGTAEGLNFGVKGVFIVLQPYEELTHTTRFVDYYCSDSSSTYLYGPIPVGAIVEAYNQDMLLVGQKMVTQSGKYGFMPVNRAWDEVGDVGAETGNLISFRVNDMPAITTGNTMFPPDLLGASMDVCLEVKGSIIKECVLTESWNLVSWNVETETTDILTVLGPYMHQIDVILGFEQGGLTFDPDLQAFSTLLSVDHLSGYWIKVKDGQEITLEIEGLPVPFLSTTIPVNVGWNLVSYLPDVPFTVDLGLYSVATYLEYAYGYDNGVQIYVPGAGSLNTLTELAPCNGYWLKLTQAGYLAVNGMDSIPAAPPQQENAIASANKGGVATSTRWVNLYSHDLTVNGKSVSSGTVVKAFTADDNQLIGSFTMQTDGRFGFMPVYADNSSEVTAGMQVGDDFYLQVGDVVTDEVFTWSANGDRIEITSLSAANSVGDVSLPNDFSLGQNYPNPFNPSTNIQFTVPVAGKARIDVFDVLGRLIATPFDAEASAGENTIIWNGRNSDGQAVASGVYFYRLTADNYSETRKMMLLK